MFDLDNIPDFTNEGLPIRLVSEDGQAAFGLNFIISDVEGAARGLDLLSEMVVTNGENIAGNLLVLHEYAGYPGVANVQANLPRIMEMFGNVELDGTILGARLTEGFIVEVFGIGNFEQIAYLLVGLAHSVRNHVLPGFIDYVEKLGLKEELEERAEAEMVERAQAIANISEEDLPTAKDLQEALGISLEEAEDIVSNAHKGLAQAREMGEEIRNESSQKTEDSIDWD